MPVTPSSIAYAQAAQGSEFDPVLQDKAAASVAGNTPVPGVQHGTEKMVIMYTCTVCNTRSARTISKVSHGGRRLLRSRCTDAAVFNMCSTLHPCNMCSSAALYANATSSSRPSTYDARSQVAYTTGVVLVRCPGCRNLHLVADHLGYFDDESVDVEQIMRARGEAVRVGAIAGDGDAFVAELTPADAAVLASTTRSVNLTTDAEVDEQYERRPAGGPDFSIAKDDNSADKT